MNLRAYYITFLEMAEPGGGASDNRPNDSKFVVREQLKSRMKSVLWRS